MNTLRPVAPPPVKSRACGLAYTPDTWPTLSLVGYLDDTVDVLEHRNCPCGSTLCVITQTREDESE